jgi:exonuclease VII small subunit
MATIKSLNYQALQQELEQLLADLQAGQLSIDEALAAYELSVAWQLLNNWKRILNRLKTKLPKSKHVLIIDALY